jgi:hypothetical protein
VDAVSTWARRVRQEVILGLVAVALASCDDDAATTVRLTLRYDDAWGLDAVEIKAQAQGTTGGSPIARELQLLVPDAWAGRAVKIELWGLRGEERYAYGSATVSPVLKGEVRADVPLTRLPCGAWCTTGAMQCDGEAVVVCEQRNDDSCLEWSEPVPCSSDAPYCSFGVCAATCTDECATGEARCDGPSAVRQCGRTGSRPCLAWLPAVVCGAGETCSNGRCATGCTDECAPNARRCVSGGVAICADFNHDDCREWGPVTPCAEGQSCTSGVCIDGCVDECRGPVCEGLVFRQCGHYDLSGCLKLSGGTSCVPTDVCLVGRCTAQGCVTEPRLCTSPPAAECLSDGITLRTYPSPGTCADGGCSYDAATTSCSPGECRLGACVPRAIVTGQTGINRIAVDAANVYWTTNGNPHRDGVVMVIPKAGGTALQLAPGQDAITLAVDTTDVYWPNYLGNSIKRAPLGGGTVFDLVVDSHVPLGLALDASRVYWITGGDWTVRSVEKSGTDERILANLDHPVDIVVDDTWAYVLNGDLGSDEGALWKIPKDGGAATSMAEHLGRVAKLYADATTLYIAGENWAQPGFIKSLPKSGGEPRVLLSNETIDPSCGLALDETNIYFSNYRYHAPTTVLRMAKSGGPMTVIADSQVSACYIAVDDAAVYWSTGSDIWAMAK